MTFGKLRRRLCIGQVMAEQESFSVPARPVPVCVFVVWGDADAVVEFAVWGGAPRRGKLALEFSGACGTCKERHSYVSYWCTLVSS